MDDEATNECRYSCTMAGQLGAKWINFDFARALKTSGPSRRWEVTRLDGPVIYAHRSVNCRMLLGTISRTCLYSDWKKWSEVVKAVGGWTRQPTKPSRLRGPVQIQVNTHSGPTWNRPGKIRAVYKRYLYFLDSDWLNVFFIIWYRANGGLKSFSALVCLFFKEKLDVCVKKSTGSVERQRGTDITSRLMHPRRSLHSSSRVSSPGFA